MPSFGDVSCLVGGFVVVVGFWGEVTRQCHIARGRQINHCVMAALREVIGRSLWIPVSPQKVANIFPVRNLNGTMAQTHLGID